MSILHILKEPLLPEPLSYSLAPSDGILLIENAVLLLQHSAKWQLLKHYGNQIYVLSADVTSRGINLDIQDIIPVDYPAFVDLVIQHDTNIRW